MRAAGKVARDAGNVRSCRPGLRATLS
jgi:hypothetical protein